MASGMSDELRLALGLLQQQARDRGHYALEGWHVLGALLVAPRSAAVMSACGADLAALERDVVAALATLDGTRAPGDPDQERLLGLMADVVALVGETVARGSVVTPEDALARIAPKARPRGLGGVLGGLFPEAPVHACLRRHGLHAVHVRAQRGAADDPHALDGTLPRPPGADHAVVVEDDDTTTMHTVVLLLQQAVGMSTFCAVRRMLAIHAWGSGVVAWRTASEAHAVAGQLRQAAQALDMPLVVRVQAPG